VRSKANISQLNLQHGDRPGISPASSQHGAKPHKVRKFSLSPALIGKSSDCRIGLSARVSQKSHVQTSPTSLQCLLRLRPQLSQCLLTLRYVMYFRFCERRRVLGTQGKRPRQYLVSPGRSILYIRQSSSSFCCRMLNGMAVKLLGGMNTARCFD